MRMKTGITRHATITVSFHYFFLKSLPVPCHKKITITYKNNSNENINSFNTIVLFYKNEEVVGLGQVGGCFKDSNGNCIEVFKKGEEVTEVVKYPIAKDYKNKVDFDRFEIIVNEAYTKD